MTFDLGIARLWAQALWVRALAPGCVAVDATMGNGGDTVELARLVGEGGRVYAFDIQPDAVRRTRERLAGCGLMDRAVLIEAGHERMGERVPESVDLIAFNLGWLPRGDKQITTRVKTTLRAVSSGLKLLKPRGLMTICAYPGHDEGTRELIALTELTGGLSPSSYQVMIQRYHNQANDPPVLIAIHKRD